MTQPVRVRYAPSPTGLPHVGNIRTAFFNWLFARHTGGKFIVRIEDTDVARTVPGALEGILEGLEWLGIDWDEGPQAGGDFGPYFQSQRLDIYKKLADELVERGYAYYCHCSSERLESMRAAQIAAKQPTGYDRCCREKGLGPAPGAVIRFKTPMEGKTTFHDLIRGDVTFENALLDDFVLLKSDGYPTYHLANVIDDHLMQISHVLRAEEWLSSTPKHLLLYNAFGYEPAQFAHLPIILGSARSKLSKRHGAVSILEYKEKGYLPEAMMNFLALLGWAFDDKTELFSKEELIQNFSIERISQTSAIFNADKLDWMDGIYIRNLTVDDLTVRLSPFLEKNFPPEIKRPLDINYIHQIVPLIRERIVTLKDAAAYAEFFFLDNLEYDSAKLIGKNMTVEATITAAKAIEEKISSLESFSRDLLEDASRHIADCLGIKTGQLFNFLRVATTGRDAAPPLFETMEVLGRERCLKRIRAALAKLANN
jgi:glutamyl-tRNA synthetase